MPFVNLSRLYTELEADLLDSMKQVMKRSAFIGGTELKSFEKNFASWIGEGLHVVGCGNGTDAIHLAARSLNLPPGTEAVVPAMTFFATVEGLVQAGLKIRLVDIDPTTYLMDLDQVSKICAEGPKLIVPVHLYGQMVAMDQVRAIAQESGSWILEDAAQAHGAKWKGKGVGTWSDVATYSFYPAKNLGAFGDAGAILSRSMERIDWCRRYGNHGDLTKFEHELFACNSRLDNLQAAVLNVKLKHIDKWNRSRNEVALWYAEALSKVESVQLPEIAASAYSVFHLYVVQVPERKAFQNYLKSKGIGTGVHYPRAIHQWPGFVSQGSQSMQYPNAERLAACGVSLPMCPTMDRSQVSYVVEVMKGFFE